MAKYCRGGTRADSRKANPCHHCSYAAGGFPVYDHFARGETEGVRHVTVERYREFVSDRGCVPDIVRQPAAAAGIIPVAGLANRRIEALPMRKSRTHQELPRTSHRDIIRRDRKAFQSARRPFGQSHRGLKSGRSCLTNIDRPHHSAPPRWNWSRDLIFSGTKAKARALTGDHHCMLMSS